MIIAKNADGTYRCEKDYMIFDISTRAAYQEELDCWQAMPAPADEEVLALAKEGIAHIYYSQRPQALVNLANQLAEIDAFEATL